MLESVGDDLVGDTVPSGGGVDLHKSLVYYENTLPRGPECLVVARPGPSAAIRPVRPQRW
jgi:hypothetical protein